MFFLNLFKCFLFDRVVIMTFFKVIFIFKGLLRVRLGLLSWKSCLLVINMRIILIRRSTKMITGFWLRLSYSNRYFSSKFWNTHLVLHRFMKSNPLLISLNAIIKVVVVVEEAFHLAVEQSSLIRVEVVAIDLIDCWMVLFCLRKVVEVVR